MNEPNGRQNENVVVCPGCGQVTSTVGGCCSGCGALVEENVGTTAELASLAATTPHPSFAKGVPVGAGGVPVGIGSLATESGLTAEMLRDSPTAEGQGALTSSRPRLDHSLVGALVGEYRVNGVIGEGGMGTVFAGEQPLIGKQVAIKILKSSLSDDGDVVERFLAEAKAVNTIRHPNIIDIFSFGTLPDGEQYFVMEYLEGCSLAAYLKEHQPLGYRVARNILGQVLDALAAAHRHGIVHRDLKPDNIYLARRPNGDFLVKLLDFGVAKFTEEGVSVGRTRTGVPIGTPLYMSPEQCRGRDVSFPSDLYSLGVIMYEMFTGRTPFVAKTVYELVNAHVTREPIRPSSVVDFPGDLERVILWCLAKDQVDRPESAEALWSVLDPMLAELAGPDARAAPTPMPPMPEDILDSAAFTSQGRRAGQSTGGPPTSRWRYLGFALVVAVASVAAVVTAFLLTRQLPSANHGADMTARGPDPSLPPRQKEEPIRSDPRPEVKKVVVQFAVTPSSANPQIWVNGEEVKGTEIWVERSTTDRLKLRVEAEGYEPYEASPLPVSDLYINVPLTRQRGSMERPGHRRSGSHAAMAMEPSATEAMPADPRTPPAEMRVKRFNEL